MIEPKILNIDDLSQIIDFEKKRLELTMADEADRELYSWHASWRKESLEHYLPLGWSFGLWSKETSDSHEANRLRGYFIAQPQLFLRGMTQTLWVERLVAENAQETSDLIELVYKVCRDKHFQKALFLVHEDVSYSNSVFQLNQVGDTLMELKTAKF
ncbi:MAG: hypothetical protein KDD38_00445 [Bdellovibrionales bacterium]|nr:hypothetical protein [Bdellovibrionales bacterium]